MTFAYIRLGRKFTPKLKVILFTNRYIHKNTSKQRRMECSGGKKRRSLFMQTYVHLKKQEAFEKCWAHSPLRAAARVIHQVSLLTPSAHRCPRQRRRQRRRRQQRQRVTEGTAMAPQNGPNKAIKIIGNAFDLAIYRWRRFVQRRGSADEVDGHS